MCQFCNVNPEKPCVECGKKVCIEKREMCVDCAGWVCPECAGPIDGDLLNRCTSCAKLEAALCLTKS